MRLCPIKGVFWKGHLIFRLASVLPGLAQFAGALRVQIHGFYLPALTHFKVPLQENKQHRGIIIKHTWIGFHFKRTSSSAVAKHNFFCTLLCFCSSRWSVCPPLLCSTPLTTAGITENNTTGNWRNKVPSPLNWSCDLTGAQSHLSAPESRCANATRQKLHRQ